jgi:hypothetical protein
MSTMSEQLEWIEESESTYVAQSGKRRYVISKQSDGQWAVELSDGGALFSAKVNKPRLAATLEEAEQDSAWLAVWVRALTKHLVPPLNVRMAATRSAKTPPTMTPATGAAASNTTCRC